MTATLNGRSIAYLVFSGFTEVEMTETQKALVAEGAKTKIISRENGLVNGWHDHSWGHFFPTDGDLATALAVDFDAIVVPGGSRSLAKLKAEPHVKRFLASAMNGDQPVVLFGEAVSLLADLEFAAGRTVAAHESSVEALTAAGATVSEDALVVDGNLITVQDIELKDDVLAALREAVAKGTLNEAA